jgi:hypothetical protein
MAFKVWNPKIRQQDRMHLMPIITPAFPSMNSTHNVTETTQRILMDEFRRGAEVMDFVEKGKVSWAEVYRAAPFFAQHRTYLKIEVLGKTPQVFTKWFGWIESKLRHLVKNLEQISSMRVRPWPNHIVFKDSEWPHATAMFMGLSLTNKKHSVDLRSHVAKFVEHISTWHDIEQKNAGLCEMRIKDVARRNLPAYVPEDPLKPRTKRSLSDISEKTRLDSVSIAATPEPPPKRLRVEDPEASVALPLPSAAAAAIAPAADIEEPAPKKLKTETTASQPEAAKITAAVGLVDQTPVAEGASAEANGAHEPGEVLEASSVPQQVAQTPTVASSPSAPSGIAIKRGKAKITVKLQ